MTDPTVYGLTMDGDDVERILLSHLRARMPEYLPEIRRQKVAAALALGLAADDPNLPPAVNWPAELPPVESYAVVHAANEKWPEAILPMLIAYCPGLAQPPVIEGDGGVTAKFAVSITAIASGFDQADTKSLARAYGSAARLAILQHQDLAGDGASQAEGVSWLDMRNYQITKGVEGERNLMAVTDLFAVEIPQVLDRFGGVPQIPDNPVDDPPPPYSRVMQGGGSARVEMKED